MALGHFVRMLKWLSDVQKPLSLAGLYNFSGMSRDEERLFREAWPRIPTGRRRQIIQALVEMAEQFFDLDFRAIFRLCLSDEDEVVRAQAIEGLWEDEDVSLISPLLALLQRDPSPLVRARAATSLSRYVLLGELEELEERYVTPVRKALLEVIYNENEALEVRRRAIEAIAYWNTEETRAIIESAYYHEEEKMRISAVFAMGRSYDAAWGDLVMGELQSPNPEMRYEAAMACGELELREAVPSLARLVGDPDFQVREAAVWALGRIGGKEARRILLALRDNGDEDIQEAVEEALEELEFGMLVPLDFLEEEDY